MCFNVSLTKEAFIRDERFHYLLPEGFEGSFHFNALDFPVIPIVCSSSPEKAVMAGWGLIPSWIKDEKDAGNIRYKTINARAETAGKKPSFRDCWPEKRCLVPVEGFFEQHMENGIKNPWYITKKDRKLFFLGGIYQHTPENLEGFSRITFSILTVQAKGLLAEVHNDKLRMPLMIDADTADLWLKKNNETGGPPDLKSVIDQDLLEAWPVDKSVFKTGKNNPAVRKMHIPVQQQKLLDF